MQLRLPSRPCSRFPTAQRCLDALLPSAFAPARCATLAWLPAPYTSLPQVFLLYGFEREVAPVVKRADWEKRPFGAHMDVARMVALQVWLLLLCEGVGQCAVAGRAHSGEGGSMIIRQHGKLAWRLQGPRACRHPCCTAAWLPSLKSRLLLVGPCS